MLRVLVWYWVSLFSYQAVNIFILNYQSPDFATICLVNS